MASEARGARLSPLERERFGIEAARLDALTPQSLKPALDFCRERDVRLLIANCRPEERAALYEGERQGFQLMDTIVVFEQRLGGTSPPVEASVEVRPARPGDKDEIVALARIAFADYVNHYHADPRLDRAAAAEVYPDWTGRLLAQRDDDHEVLVAESDGVIVGFHALARYGDRATQPLSGVRPGIQGKHVYQTMNTRGIEWAIASGAKTIDGAVQLTNTAIQRALWRRGYVPVGAYFVLHKWFD